MLRFKQPSSGSRPYRYSIKFIIFVQTYKSSFLTRIFTVAPCILLNYEVFILSNGCTIKYSKKNVKIYIKIDNKSAPTCFGLNNNHQGAWHMPRSLMIVV